MTPAKQIGSVLFRSFSFLFGVYAGITNKHIDRLISFNNTHIYIYTHMWYIHIAWPQEVWEAVEDARQNADGEGNGVGQTFALFVNGYKCKSMFLWSTVYSRAVIRPVLPSWSQWQRIKRVTWPLLQYLVNIRRSASGHPFGLVPGRCEGFACRNPLNLRITHLH